MATINHGVMGGFSGAVGTVVGANWNGIDYMRAKRSTLKDAKSAAQIDQRARLVAVIQFLKPFKAFLPVGFKNHKKGLTPFNAAVSCNMQNALTGISPDYDMDYSKIKISIGPMPSALNSSVVKGQAGELLFTWGNNSDKLGAMANDKVVLVVYDPNSKKITTLLDGNTRIVGNHAFALPHGFGGENLQCYIAFRNARLTDISDSQYVGSISI